MDIFRSFHGDIDVVVMVLRVRRAPVVQNLAVVEDKIQFKQLATFYQKHQGEMMTELEDCLLQKKRRSVKQAVIARTSLIQTMASSYDERIKSDWYVIFKKSDSTLETK